MHMVSTTNGWLIPVMTRPIYDELLESKEVVWNEHA